MLKEKLGVLSFFVGFIYIAIFAYLVGSCPHGTFNFIDWGYENKKVALAFFISVSFWWCACYVITKIKS